MAKQAAMNASQGIGPLKIQNAHRNGLNVATMHNSRRLTACNTMYE